MKERKFFCNKQVRKQLDGTRTAHTFPASSLFRIDLLLRTLCEELLLSITNQLEYPLQVFRPVIVTAPPYHSRSNAWTHLPLHRDSQSLEYNCYFSCILLLSNVTESNGPTIVFPGTHDFP